MRQQVQTPELTRAALDAANRRGARLWKTRTERLAEALRRSGYKVVLVSSTDKDKEEAQNA